LLEKVIDEALRIHCTSGIGLARVVPEGGATVCGRFFEAGTVLSVPVSLSPFEAQHLVKER
jgi:benzoate 4-monooxygenase